MSNEGNTPADARADVDKVIAGAALTGAGATADQADVKTGTVQTGFSEVGHMQMSDVNVQELVSASTGLMASSQATLKATFDAVSGLRAQNAAIIDNMTSANAVHLNNLVNSASHRHSEIAADRQWNLNETDFYATVAAAVAAAMAEASFKTQ